MSAQKNSTNGKEERKGKVKVGKLHRNLEAVTDLTAAEAEKIKGGFVALEHEQIHVAHEQVKSAVAGCSTWACTSNHNETLVRDAASMQ